MATGTISEIVIAPRVLEKSLAIATLAKVDGVHLCKQEYVDSLAKLLLRGQFIFILRILICNSGYLSVLEYGVGLPGIIQKVAVLPVHDMAVCILSAVNVHVAGIVSKNSKTGYGRFI